MNDTVSVEDRLLGGLIEGMSSHPAMVAPLLDILEPKHFGKESNRAVYVAVATLYRLGRTIDLVHIYQFLRKPGHCHLWVGGLDLADLWTMRCHPDEVQEFAALLVRGIGRSSGTTPQTLPIADLREDTTSLRDVDTSFEFGANAPESESAGTDT